jgi:hypothetical protein
MTTRAVSMVTLEKLNGDDDGHVLFELWHPDIRRWVLYDVSTNTYFTDKNGRELSALEMVDRARSGNFHTRALAADALGDASFDTPDERRRWHARVFQRLSLLEDHRTVHNNPRWQVNRAAEWVTFDSRRRSLLKATVISRGKFVNRFYAKPPVNDNPNQTTLCESASG